MQEALGVAADEEPDSLKEDSSLQAFQETRDNLQLAETMRERAVQERDQLLKTIKELREQLNKGTENTTIELAAADQSFITELDEHKNHVDKLVKECQIYAEANQQLQM